LIGTVGSEDKRAAALANGCEAVLLSDDPELVPKVREFADGRGADVVYDSVGQDTFSASLDCLVALGTLVSFGQSSGMPPAITTADLASRGSLTLVRPIVFDYIATTEVLRQTAESFFAIVKEGAVQLSLNHCYPLTEVARAHQELEQRQTQGLAVLTP
jgi:NADPH2:quinone reductase